MTGQYRQEECIGTLVSIPPCQNCDICTTGTVSTCNGSGFSNPTPSCKECEKCQEGEYISNNCGQFFGADVMNCTKCSGCGKGTYLSGNCSGLSTIEDKICLPCASCRKGDYISQEGCLSDGESRDFHECKTCPDCSDVSQNWAFGAYISKECSGTAILRKGICAVKAVSASSQTCAIMANNYMKCFGLVEKYDDITSYQELEVYVGNEVGSMGDNLDPMYLGLVRAVSVAEFRSCAILWNHSIVCWGRIRTNLIPVYRMGDSWNYRNTEPVELPIGRSPVALQCVAYRCYTWLDDGMLAQWDLPSMPSATKQNSTLVQIGVVRNFSMSWSHQCALLYDKNVSCWGSNSNGECGFPWTSEIPLGRNIDLSFAEGHDVDAITCLYDRSCVLLSNGQVACWGGAGTSSTYHIPVFLDLGSSHTAKSIYSYYNYQQLCVILDDDTVACWKAGLARPVVKFENNLGAKSLAVGMNHICAILTDDSLRCWGSNEYGQLGLENTFEVADPSTVNSSSLGYCPLPGQELTEILSSVDRKCNGCTSCQPGTFVYEKCDGTAFGNTPTCKPCERCDPGQYISIETGSCDGKGLNASRRSCKACKSCSVGEYNYEGICDGSELGGDTKTKCEKCTPCDKGSYIDIKCDGKGFGAKDRTCARCGLCSVGEFMTGCGGDTSSDDHKCEKCDPCNDGEFVGKQCTGASFYTRDRECIVCQECADMQIMTNGCTGSELSSGRNCEQCQSCGTNHFISKGCNGKTTKQECSPCRKCGDYTYVSGRCTGVNKTDTSRCPLCSCIYTKGMYIQADVNKNLVKCTDGLPNHACVFTGPLIINTVVEMFGHLATNVTISVLLSDIYKQRDFRTSVIQSHMQIHNGVTSVVLGNIYSNSVDLPPTFSYLTFYDTRESAVQSSASFDWNR